MENKGEQKDKVYEKSLQQEAEVDHGMNETTLLYQPYAEDPKGITTCEELGCSILHLQESGELEPWETIETKVRY